MTTVATAAPPLANVFSHQAEDGQSYFALSLRPDAIAADTKTPHDHVILVDTSASQAGVHRTQAFAVVKSFLASLPKGDRVRLFAVDLKADSLNPTFAAPGSDDVAKAFKTLNRRFPAGATDMVAAINAAAAAFDGKQTASVLYVGDGMSSGNLVQSEQMKKLIGVLSSRKIAVHSYAVGPKKDLNLLGMLAQQTGGVVLEDRGDDIRDQPQTVGTKLAASAIAPILYPTSIQVQPAVTLLPGKALPMRTDRETIYLGKGKLTGDVNVTVQDGKSAPRKWTIASKRVSQGHAYVRLLWNRAEQTNGLSVSLAGNRMLNAAHDEFNDEVDRLVEVGNRAVASRQFERAEQIGLAIQKLDATNVTAKTILQLAAKGSAQPVAFVQAKQPAKKAPAKKAPDGGIGAAAKAAKEDDPLRQQAQIQAALLQMLQNNVASAIQVARSIATDDAAGALSILKEQLDTVIATNRVDPVGRQQLIKRIRATMEDVRSNREANDIKRIRDLERRALQEAQDRIKEQLQIEEDKLATLVEQVRGLIEDGIHGNYDAYEEAEAVARVAVDLKPGDGTAAAALFMAEATGHLSKSFRLRSLRADRFLETLHQVELSHVPFPDEPPIRWPSAEVWQALTERRKKWASVDLHKNSPAEERIQQELKSRAQDYDYVDSTLKEVIEDLQDRHSISIIPDPEAVASGDLTLDSVVNLTLSGVTLRSALRLILEQHADVELSYIVEDEVMKIVTREKADSIQTVRVYPVGDLVIPIPPPGALGGGGGFGGGGGGGLGGGGGQFGGGGGQFGGGGGQFGGGGGQFGGGGGGGGFFSIPPAGLPRVRRPRQPARNKNANKKKPVGDAELQGIFDRVLSQNDNRFVGQAFAQVRDQKAERGFRLDNETVRNLKKKLR